MLKSKIRKKILKIRKERNFYNKKFNFLKIFNEIKKENIKKKVIGGYYPINFEIDILDFLSKIESKCSQISLPAINKNSQMDFFKWSYNDLLKLNKFGIPEPLKNKKVIPDIVFLPLVAFDKRLYRVGYGGGYYDRYIEKILNKKKILKIGIAHSCQKINRVPENKYDKKLDMIITEKYILR